MYLPVAKKMRFGVNSYFASAIYTGCLKKKVDTFE